MNPGCTVIIPTRNRASLLRRCLESLGRQTISPTEIVVVDNAPYDSTTGDVAREFAVRHVVEPVVGVDRARNRGALESRSELIALIDDDAVAEPGWLAALVEEFADANVAAAGGRVLPLTDSGASPSEFEAFWTMDYGRETRKLSPDSPRWFEEASFGVFGCGPSLAFRREPFLVCGGFDERLSCGRWLQREEQDLFARLLAAGHSVVYTPKSVVRHRYPESWDDLRNRYLHELRATTGYLALVMVERPGFRWRTVRYVFSRLQHKMNSSQLSNGRSDLKFTAAGWLARIRGVCDYFEHVFGHDPVLAPDWRKGHTP